MKIAINTQHLLKNKLEGIGWFSHETIRRIVRNHPEHEFIFIFDRPWDDCFIYADNVTPVKTEVPARHPLLYIWHYDVQIPRILKKLEADVFFSPDGWMSLRTDVPTVNVIHDVNFMHRPEDFPWSYRKYFQHFFPKFAHKAKKLITVSNYSKKDISGTFHLDPSKIDVAYNGCRSSFKPLPEELKEKVQDEYTNGDPYFVYVGSINPRKNIKTLLCAFDRFKTQCKLPHKLLIVGKAMNNADYLSDTILNLKHKKDVLCTGRVSDDAVPMLMGAAEALCLVSHNEGFGIPVLEAMNCGVPSICSNITALPEISGDAAVLIDPSSDKSIADAMFQIASNKSFRTELIENGRIQKDNFSWEKSAEIVWNAIEQCAKQ